MTTRPNPLSAQELVQLNDAESFLHMKNSSAYNKLIVMLKLWMNVALDDLETNPHPRMDSYYRNRWVERKALVNAIQGYVDNIIAKRRDTLAEILREIGLPESVIEQNMDMSFDFLTHSVMGGPNGNDTTTTRR